MPIQPSRFNASEKFRRALLKAQSECRPSLISLFKSNATEIYVFRELGGTVENLVQLLDGLGYKSSPVTVRAYLNATKKLINKSEATRQMSEARKSKKFTS